MGTTSTIVLGRSPPWPWPVNNDDTIADAMMPDDINVPKKPTEEPGKVLFLWPAVNPSGPGGMMQPVLTYGADYGQGAGKWGMANWFTNCASSSGL